MIFFTVGTERFPFKRMLRAAEEVSRQLNEEVFIQTGSNGLRPSRWVSRSTLSFTEMMQKLAEARVVVTHAGVGTLLLCASLEKNPIMVPRLKRHGEHVDDHQVELAEKVAHLGHALLARDSKEIVELVMHFDEMRKRLKPFSSRSPSLARTLMEYLP